MRRTLLIFLLIHTAIVNAQTWQWAKGNTGGIIEGGLVAADPNGNTYLTGLNLSLAPAFGFDTVYNTSAIWQSVIAKFDSSGTNIWAIGSENGVAVPLNIAADRFGNVYLLGVVEYTIVTFDTVTIVNNKNNLRTFLFKFNSSGRALWGRFVSDSFCTGLTVDGYGNAFVSGIFNSSSDTFDTHVIYRHSYLDDIFIVKYDPAGNVVWAKCIGGTDDDFAGSIAATQSGEVYLTGAFKSASIAVGNLSINKTGTTDILLCKLDSAGNPIWAKDIPQNAADIGIPTVATDLENDVFITGSFYDIIVLGSDTFRTYPTNNIIFNMYVAKFDSSGSAVWANKGSGGPSSYVGTYNIASDGCGNVWVNGVIQDTTSVNIKDSIIIGTHVCYADTGDGLPVFIAGFDPSGNVIGLSTINVGGEDDETNGLAVDTWGNVYVAGDYAGKLIAGNIGLTDTTGAEPIFLAKYRPNNNCTPLRVSKKEQKPEITIYPNPAYDHFTIAYSGTAIQNSKADLYNITGQLVYSTTLKENETTVYTNTLPPGIYICKISISGQQLITRKVLVGR